MMVIGISKVLKPKVDEDRNQRFSMLASCSRVKEVISFFLIYFIFKLYIIVLVLPNIKMNPPRYTCVISNSNTEFLEFLHSGY